MGWREHEVRSQPWYPLGLNTFNIRKSDSMQFSKTIVLLVATLILASLFTACGSKDEGEIPEFRQYNAIILNDDLSVGAIMVDTFEQDYYRREELMVMVSEEAYEFNGTHGAGAMLLERVLVEDKKVNVALKFADADAYAAYKDAFLFAGSLEEAKELGLYPDAPLLDFNNAEKSIEPEAAMALKNAYILITDEHMDKGPLTIETFERIRYVSAGVEPWMGRNSAIVDGGGELVYIIFR